ncbi:MAG: VCBS repeat-containing protein [Gemmatales bacterium]|nr:VCBS repeat-containing protein [Gemmatales bacterium]MDW7993880.1 VCBS repeat-containing protein [Gemmatales bacterium]
MLRMRSLMVGIAVSLGVIVGVSWFSRAQEKAPPSRKPLIRWEKIVLDRKFWSEGVAVADVNRDGRLDVIAGDVWYEAPQWQRHFLRPVRRRDKGNPDEGHDPHNYSNSFACFADDFNRDGWPDVIILPFPGEACYWYENPKGQGGYWRAHLLWRSACNESPQYADLFGEGQRRLIMAIQPEGQMCWFEIPEDPTKPWIPHAISEPKAPGTDRFSHGLGVGDVNRDGRPDVLVTAGWWEQPAEGKKHAGPWKFHPAKLGGPCADMIVFDVDGDGLNDVITSSAHGRGIWWRRQLPEASGSRFQQHDIYMGFTQTHAVVFTDINGDGRPDIVTGKRWWAHGPKGDKDPLDPEEPNRPAVLYWFEIVPQSGAPPRFIPHQVDDDSGIGTQFTVADLNADRLPDIVVANKKGVFVFLQKREP